MARPTKLTEVGDELLELVKGGSSYAAACALTGIHPETLRRWRDLGLKKGAKEPYRGFAIRFERARYEGQETLRKGILAAGTGKKGDWRALAFLLERQFPEEFGKRVIEQRHTGPDGASPVTFEFDLSDKTTESLEELLAQLRSEQGASELEP